MMVWIFAIIINNIRCFVFFIKFIFFLVAQLTGETKECYSDLCKLFLFVLNKFLLAQLPQSASLKLNNSMSFTVVAAPPQCEF